MELLSTTLFDFYQRQNRSTHKSAKNKKFASPSCTIQSFLDDIESFHEFMAETGVTFIVPAKELVIQGKYSGFSICFSGAKEKDLEHEITRLKGKIASGISKITTHLVIKDSNGTSSKISKALQLNIPILTSNNSAIFNMH